MINVLSLIILIIFFYSCSKDPVTEETGEPAGIPVISTRTILSGHEIIWGMDFLPNGDLIFTEKQGKIYIRSGETTTELSGFPEVLSNGQGGLLDLKLHPGYSNNGWIYACFSAANPDGGGMLKLIRFKISGNQIQNIEIIFSSVGSNTWYGHYGSRIVFDSNNYIFLAVGEGGPRSYGGPNTNNNNAQDGKVSWGKIHRIKDDGSIPDDNPVLPGNTGPTSIYSFGHRNPQGLAFHPDTRELWEAEHGPRGGDEINIIKKGANYGWPVYSLGVNYDGTPISNGHTASGITEPLYTWTPSIGVCGITFITSSKFKSWQGNLLATGLASEKLYRCVVEGDKITSEEVILSNSGRVRNVVEAPDGSIYVSVENPGRIIQITAE